LYWQEIFREDYHVREYGFGERRPEEYGVEELKVPPSHENRPREAADLNVIRETIEQPVNKALKEPLAVDQSLRTSAAVMADCLPHNPVDEDPYGNRSQAVWNYGWGLFGIFETRYIWNAVLYWSGWN
jgi:hypothetical protein